MSSWQTIERWWREFRKPSLKCERLGHDMRERREEFWETPDPKKDIFWLRYVAVRVVEITPVCARCWHSEEPRELHRNGLHGLTMGQDHWDIMREKGRVKI